ncbi:resistance to lethality of mkk1p386 overexpression [Ophidiomyces ophidiicola]|uniref:Resistance to lethality of mkk1p386 overexpression n=1 Tax=Ophidiomyces ophidiicola TaxID=1387563 RepID=A0ACB8UMX7_9EURO|nr:resistance to lethality of mkk1p386 overexpression [Ophidiomyces ophidiicola]KAI1913119.1 resistance to lethality of mkk1p386 overexpression [Ophidiomyces ophidiicola]KAI1920323.1 resistance to lethality of mkk1p386 overexpression [Ophidiomyces ophidiicola]KAI1928531.1 resistance to lethality of mkk1p386 overexpression [Ophidiomyces ophidiicola]KAI1935194.1 resistance to lethality of mkk1p386 overexpression [Ophidiomyces ophidiicola]KAI1946183.1 resistance to lethality of mkk1p386 overexpre
MGRRKIEIKAIKDDRNRSVTFLKRKGGLFKKAHELSVLCSVDVTVIIFGHNKKLYEFSSGDIQETLSRYQYYGQAHEHKGPADFAGKQNLDEEDEDDISPPPDELGQQIHRNGVPPPPPQQSAFQHVNHTPSVSPPIPNGVQFHPRNGTPQPPPGVGSRPSSRNTIPAVSSNLVPPQHHHATPPPQVQNGYGYITNPSVYNPQGNPNMPQQPRPGAFQYARPPPPQSVAQQQGQQPPMPSHHQHPSIPQVQQQQQIPHHPYMQDQQRRPSMPPAFSQQDRHPPPPVDQPMPSQHQEPKVEHQPSPPSRQHPTKSRSIFTPIDDRGSVLAQHFGFGPPAESPKTDSPVLKELDKHGKPSAPPPPRPQPPRSLPNPQRTPSTSSVPDIHPISRNNSIAGNVKRPQLKVQIPSEQSDAGEATTESSSRDSGNVGATPAKTGSDPGHSAVVLPPPSPSASALLSAGAHGPPNPFARPPPPGAVPQATGSNIETPMSALPSRFVSDALLPSPSSFYPEWGFGRTGPDSNMLPSPLTFPTPVMQAGTGFVKEVDEQERKRKSPETGTAVPDPVGAGKRLKVE